MIVSTVAPTLSLLLCCLLIAPPGWSQATAVATSNAPASSLQLKVLDTDGSQIYANSASQKGFWLEVTDSTGSPVSEAAVALRLPDNGATGLFGDGSHSAVVYTDSSGRAHFGGIRWSSAAGSLAIRITATKGDEHAGILLEQALVDSTQIPAVSSPVNVPVVRPEMSAIQAPRLEPANPGNKPRETADAQAEAPLNTIASPGELASVRPAIRATAPSPGVSIIRSGSPSVQISNDGSGPAYHGGFNKKKWILIGLSIAAAAGAAYFASNLGKSSTSTSGSSISIGAPTVSVGQP